MIAAVLTVSAYTCNPTSKHTLLTLVTLLPGLLIYVLLDGVYVTGRPG